MTDRRPLSTDLTDQGKWQAEHGATPDPVVVLNDGETWTPAEGCRLVVPTMEHASELHNHGMKVNDVQAVAEYNVDAVFHLAPSSCSMAASSAALMESRPRERPREPVVLRMAAQMNDLAHFNCFTSSGTVSYTHLTLPTILRV